MSHGEQQRVVELFSDGGLNLGIGGEVDTRGRFVQDDDRTSTEQCASHGDQLTLPVGEVRTARRDLSVKRNLHLARFRLCNRDRSRHGAVCLIDRGRPGRLRRRPLRLMLALSD